LLSLGLVALAVFLFTLVWLIFYSSILFFTAIKPICIGFYSKTAFWPSYCQISIDLDKILHTTIVVRNTLVGQLRPRSARGRLQAKPKRLCFCNPCNAP